MHKIILIVGASGVGKDTLIKGAQSKIDANFSKRYITRIPDDNEDNFFVDKDAFLLLKENDFFISTWEAHGNFYGISKNQIKEGLNIISISRNAIKDFEDYFEDVTCLNITLSKDELKKRLVRRNRETKEEIEKRISRSYPKIDAKNVIEFDNSKSIEESSADFIKIIQGIKNQK